MLLRCKGIKNNRNNVTNNVTILKFYEILAKQIEIVKALYYSILRTFISFNVLFFFFIWGIRPLELTSTRQSFEPLDNRKCHPERVSFLLPQVYGSVRFTNALLHTCDPDSMSIEAVPRRQDSRLTAAHGRGNLFVRPRLCRDKIAQNLCITHRPREY